MSQRIDITTPVAWKGFWGRRLGRSSWGIACAFSWHAWYVGIQIVGPGKKDFGGLALAIGPLWLGVAKLITEQDQ